MKRQLINFNTILFSLLFVNIIAAINVFAGDDNQGVKFRDLTLEQALALSKKENKPLFVHCYADWCHYCMYMRDSVYPDKEVGDLVNSKFISIKLNIEKEGAELNKTLKSHNYPTLLFYDTNGEMMHRAAGRKYKKPFMDLVNEALDPKRQMRYYKNRYESGEATPAEVQFYFRMQEVAGMDAQLMLDDYLRKQPDSLFTNANNWRIMYDIIKDPTLLVMKRFFDFRKELGEKYSADSVNNKLIILYNYFLSQYVLANDSNGFESGKKYIRSVQGLDLAEKICAYGDLNKHKLKGEWELYRTEGPKFIEKYAMDDFRRINDISNNLYEHFGGDKDLMARCEGWLKQGIKIRDIYKGNYVLANVSYLLGKKEQALNAVNHAIELGKRDNVDFSQATMVLDAINKMP